VRTLATWQLPADAGSATWHHLCALGRIQRHDRCPNWQRHHPKHDASTGRLRDCCGSVQCGRAAQPKPCSCSKVSPVQLLPALTTMETCRNTV
jgi:hypothetical protein